MYSSTRAGLLWSDPSVRNHLKAARAALAAVPPNVDVALQSLLQGLQLLAHLGMPGAEDAISIAGALLARRQQLQGPQGPQHLAASTGLQEHPHGSTAEPAGSDPDTVTQLSLLLSRVSLHAEIHSPAGLQPCDSEDLQALGAMQRGLTSHDSGAPDNISSGIQASRSSAPAPILMETGREGLAQCALDDGSHIVCEACGGVVPAVRQQQHRQFWCQALAAHTDNVASTGGTAMSTSP